MVLFLGAFLSYTTLEFMRHIDFEVICKPSAKPSAKINFVNNSINFQDKNLKLNKSGTINEYILYSQGYTFLYRIHSEIVCRINTTDIGFEIILE